MPGSLPYLQKKKGSVASHPWGGRRLGKSQQKAQDEQALEPNPGNREKQLGARLPKISHRKDRKRSERSFTANLCDRLMGALAEDFTAEDPCVREESAGPRKRSSRVVKFKKMSDLFSRGQDRSSVGDFQMRRRGERTSLFRGTRAQGPGGKGRGIRGR